VVIEASVLARLLGVRLLRLDATVVLVPADVTPRSSAPYAPPARRIRAAGPSGRTGGVAAAVRTIDEGARLLNEARREIS
jgi:hypothetical protein